MRTRMQKHSLGMFNTHDEKKDTIWCTAKNTLTTEEVEKYTVEAVLSGDDNWNPELIFKPAEKPIGYVTINRKKLPVNQYGCFERAEK